ATRLGGIINDIRRRTAESAPELSKRCRILIKNWQKLIDYARPPSNCGSSSTSTTPNLVSPAVRSRGLTPRTPKTPAKVTPSIGGLKTDTNISPGYAPKKISPLASITTTNLHKSQSVGADLSRQAVEKSISPPTKVNGEVVNGVVESLKLTIKRSAVATELNGSALKRSKSSATNLEHIQELREAKTSSPSPIQSVTAARKNVQSTTELVAQLSENLPQHMAIDLSAHEKRVKQEQTPLTVPPMTILRSSLPDVSQNKQKRKYTKRHPRFFKNGQLSPVDENETSIEGTMSEEKTEPEDLETEPETSEIHEEPETPGISEVATAEADLPTTSASVSEKSAPKKEVRRKGYDWLSIVPKSEDLANRPIEYAEPSEDPRKSYVMRIRERDVLCLPYVDIGIPDFLEYNYPDPDMFIADRSKGLMTRMP
uniref:TFIIS N-terminal domain-containing protein n=1 Tax=Acrobeloides nanus TaxID=290746 RepID=A0A914D2Q7_9BILA